MSSISPTLKYKVLRLLATGKPVYLVARELEMDARTVATIKEANPGLILAIQREEAGQRIDGTPNIPDPARKSMSLFDRLGMGYMSVLTPSNTPEPPAFQLSAAPYIAPPPAPKKGCEHKHTRVAEEKLDGLETELSYELVPDERGEICCILKDVDGEWDLAQLEKLRQELGEVICEMRHRKVS
jgi:hypothetical protein